MVFFLIKLDTIFLILKAESILECLEINEKFAEQMAEHAALQAASSQPLQLPAPPLLMRALNVNTPEDFLLETTIVLWFF